MFYTYILQSTTSGRLYIGQTNNLEDRIFRHNTNLNKATKGKGPWVLLYAKTFETRSESVHLETTIKAWKSKKYILQWIDEQQPDSASR